MLCITFSFHLTINYEFLATYGVPTSFSLFSLSVATFCPSGRKGYLWSSHCPCRFCQAQLWISRLPYSFFIVRKWLDWDQIVRTVPFGGDHWKLPLNWPNWQKGMFWFFLHRISTPVRMLLIKDYSVFFVIFIRSILVNGRVHSYPGVSFGYLSEHETLQGTCVFLSKLLNANFLCSFIWDNFTLS